MLDFALPRRFDAVVCLFGSIGYARTREHLGRAVASMARHVDEGGVLAVEPWITPERWQPGGVHAAFVDEDELKAVRMNVSREPERGVTAIEVHYLVGTRAGIDHFTERHELGLFSHDDYAAAFRAAGLVLEHDAGGLTGRGLYDGTRRGA